MNKLKVYTKTPMDRREMTLWFNVDMVSCVVKLTPRTYCVRIDGKDWLTDEIEDVEEYILKWPVKVVKEKVGRPKGSKMADDSNESKAGQVKQ